MEAARQLTVGENTESQATAQNEDLPPTDFFDDQNTFFDSLDSLFEAPQFKLCSVPSVDNHSNSGLEFPPTAADIRYLVVQPQPEIQSVEIMSNITPASGEASVSSGNSIAMADNERTRQPPPQQLSTPSSPNGAGNKDTAQQNLVKKRKRNLPGTPDPDAEVIALSPRTLTATNRFICEVCSEVFHRDQNLQLHRRCHNLPWKLKQRTSSEIRKKVYICPEPTCVYHDPARALGDLTGIKRHFCRKHGEKKWKCDRCSKRYAVQSDWKAHSKTCSTREYRCDRGTLLSESRLPDDVGHPMNNELNGVRVPGYSFSESRWPDDVGHPMNNELNGVRVPGYSFCTIGWWN